MIEQNRIAFEAARAYAQAEPLAGWLTITGGVGNGKTHLAAAIANTLSGKGVPVTFCEAPALLDYLRATFAPRLSASDVTFDERFETVKQAEALILDDLGAEDSTVWAQDKLYQVLDHRYTWQLPTVVTSNVQWTKIPIRVRSRLGDTEIGKVVINAAPDYRSAEGKKVYWH